MQNPKVYATQLNENSRPKPKVSMFFVYFMLALVLCIFSASVWFSSYAKGLYLRRKPIFERQRDKIQYEIQQLELEVNTLTDVERVRQLSKELGLVESTTKSKELRDR